MTIYEVQGLTSRETGTEDTDINDFYFPSLAEARKQFREMVEENTDGLYFKIELTKIETAPMSHGKLLLAVLNRCGWVRKSTSLKIWQGK